MGELLGHAAGDAVLQQLATRITALLRAGAIAERLRAAAAEPFLVDDTEITLSATVGSYGARSADPDEVLREADRRMYERKRRTTP